MHKQQQHLHTKQPQGYHPPRLTAYLATVLPAGSLMYMSPEMLEGRPYNEKVELPAAASVLAALSRMSLLTLVHPARTQH